MGGLANGADCRAAGHRRPLASAMALSPVDPALHADSRRPPQHQRRHSDARRADARGESALGGAPRIHGELRKLGVDVSERTVSRLVRRHRRPPSQTWRTFPTNHVRSMVSMDFFTVPTLTGRVLFVLVLLVPSPSAHCPFRITGASHRGLDGPATHRGVSRGLRPTLAPAGSRCHLWRPLPTSSRRHGHR